MLRPMPIEPIPPETARVARAAFPEGNHYLRVADQSGNAPCAAATV
jgi:transposase